MENIQNSDKLGKETGLCFFGTLIIPESIVDSSSRSRKLLSAHLIRNIIASGWRRVYFHNARRDVDNRRRASTLPVCCAAAASLPRICIRRDTRMH